MADSRIPVVAVINTSPDVVAMVATYFEEHGWVVLSGYTYEIRDGSFDMVRFLQEHHVDVVIYDIAPPYERNWLLFQHLAQTTLAGYPIVLTTTNLRRVEEVIHPEQPVYEILEKPHTLQRVLDAANEACARVRQARQGTH